MKLIRNVIITGVLATLIFPVQSAVIDRVRNKVDAIKNETSVIKRRVNGVVGNLNPLSKLQAKFQEFGFEPGQFLDMIPAEDVRNLIQELRERKAEKQAMLNDPNIENFRYEFLETLAGIRNILAVDKFDNVPSPLATLVEKAPPRVLGVLKVATEGVFERLRTNVASASTMFNELREAGLFELTNVSFEPNPHSSIPTHMQKIVFTTDERNEHICKLASKLRPRKLAIWALKQRLKYLSNHLEQFGEKLSEKEQKIDVGIHGYLGFSFIPGKNMADNIKIWKLKTDYQVIVLEGAEDVVDLVHSFEGCSLYVDWRDNEKDGT